MKLTWVLFVVLQIQLLSIHPSDGKGGSKNKGNFKSSSKSASKSSSSKMASTMGKVASSLNKPKIGGVFGVGLKAHKAIPIGAAIAGGTLLLPFLVRKKLKRKRIIPAFIGRDRSYKRNAMQCYSCEGMGNDECVMKPVTHARHITCGPGQYCSVLRREISITSRKGETTHSIMQPDDSESEVTQEFDPTDDVSVFNQTLRTAIHDLEKSLVSKSKTNSSFTDGLIISGSNMQVFISRGCNSPDGLLQTSPQHENNDKSLVTSFDREFCLTDFCNTGNGQLKCYECEGEGLTHPCMVNPTLISERITCKANHYCNILKLITMAYFPTNDTTVTKVTIVRGCSEDDEYEEQDGISLQSLSCSSDYCNGVDGNYLTDVNAVSGRHETTHFIKSVMSSIVALLVASLFPAFTL